MNNVLFVVNYPANTGYAWDYFETLFARIADRIDDRDVHTYVAYPSIPAPPETLEGSVAEAVELDVSLNSWTSRLATMEFVRRNDVGLVYFTDRATFRWSYACLRAAGVESIVVSDHTSGGRTRPSGVKRAVKSLFARLPIVNADKVVTPSDFVARRQEEVNMNPLEKIERVYYSFPLEEDRSNGEGSTHEKFEIDPSRPIVACACRAAPEKGVHHLVRAFDRMLDSGDDFPSRPALVYCGDGPYLSELKELREDVAAGDAIVFAGYQPDAVSLLSDADLFVVPSVWQDALPLAVMEPMSLGKPVIATRVGGVPEMVADGITGYLVDAGDEAALAEAMTDVLQNPEKAERMGDAGQERVARKFSPEREEEKLVSIIMAGLGLHG